MNPRRCGVWLDFLSPPGAPWRGAPGGAHLMMGEVPTLRPTARTGEKGAASGEPAGGPRGTLFSLRRPFSARFWHFMPWKRARPRNALLWAPESL